MAGRSVQQSFQDMDALTGGGTETCEGLASWPSTCHTWNKDWLCLQMAGRSMQQAVQDLAAMKAGGSTIDQREERLAEGVSQLQQFLRLLGTGHTTPAVPPPQPVGHLSCILVAGRATVEELMSMPCVSLGICCTSGWQKCMSLCDIVSV